MIINYKDYGYINGNSSCLDNYLTTTFIKILNKNQNKTILDLGCGNGWLTRKIYNYGYNIYGIDASETGIKIAKEINPDRFFIQNLSTKSLPEEISNIIFDTLISTEVIEHLYDPRSFILFCKQILLKNGGGELILSTPYHGYLKNLVMSLTGKMDQHFTALWDGGHIKFWSKKSLSNLLKEFDFEIVDFHGTGRFPYMWKSMIIKARLK
jgi:2-polyprenyl-3-methyl-5-hydroxy-6-metoxy-1,4-benzoquinol methylase